MITVIKPDYCWPETTLKMFPFLTEHLERCGRICYKSENKITETSANRFVETIRKSGHESVLEHASVTAIVTCSRACSHQLVRHRIAAYSQESQRYCNYGSGALLVICPPQIGLPPGEYTSMGRMICQDRSVLILSTRQERWIHQIESAYQEYRDELNVGIRPEDARYVLPNATKAELAVTYNLRQWRHVFQERALNKSAQWEIREVFQGILTDLAIRIPAVFNDLEKLI